MQHRLYDCYWQMRMPELEIGSDVSVALISYLDEERRGRRDRRAGPEAMRTCHENASPFSLLVVHRVCRRPRSRSPPSTPPRSMPPSRRRFRPRRPIGSRGFDQDETMKQCSLHENSPPKPVADEIQKREKARIEYPADGKLMGDWKSGEKLAQSGYGLRFTDYPAAAGQRRQLLRLPPADQGRGQLRHDRPEPARTTARSGTSARPTPRRSTRRSTTRRRPIRARTCRGFGTNNVLTIEQIKDLVALVMSPDSPVNK